MQTSIYLFSIYENFTPFDYRAFVSIFITLSCSFVLNTFIPFKKENYVCFIAYEEIEYYKIYDDFDAKENHLKECYEKTLLWLWNKKDDLNVKLFNQHIFKYLFLTIQYGRLSYIKKIARYYNDNIVKTLITITTLLIIIDCLYLLLILKN